jgi:hypothetical protein
MEEKSVIPVDESRSIRMYGIETEEQVDEAISRLEEIREICAVPNPSDRRVVDGSAISGLIPMYKARCIEIINIYSNELVDIAIHQCELMRKDIKDGLAFEDYLDALCDYFISISNHSKDAENDVLLNNPVTGEPITCFMSSHKNDLKKFLKNREEYRKYLSHPFLKD